jgi:hypothetical protein
MLDLRSKLGTRNSHQAAAPVALEQLQIAQERFLPDIAVSDEYEDLVTLLIERLDKLELVADILLAKLLFRFDFDKTRLMISCDSKIRGVSAAFSIPLVIQSFRLLLNGRYQFIEIAAEHEVAF